MPFKPPRGLEKLKLDALRYRLEVERRKRKRREVVIGVLEKLIEDLEPKERTDGTQVGARDPGTIDDGPVP